MTSQSNRSVGKKNAPFSKMQRNSDFPSLRDSKRSLEEEYEISPFGPYRLSAHYTLRYASGCKAVVDDFHRGRIFPLLERVFRMRAMQPLVDDLLRLSNRVCAPHLRNKFEERSPATVQALPQNRKWTAFEKASASLGQSLAYAVRSCREFEGILLDLHVVMERSDDPDPEVGHANFVYIDTVTSELFLFEPNGARFVERTNALRLLAEGIAEASSLGIQLEGPVVADVRGIQYLLGFEEPDSLHPFARSYAALAICNAVTYWTLHAWLSLSERMEFRSFLREFAERVAANPREARERILAFMVDTREWFQQDEPSNRMRYAALVHTALKADMALLHSSESSSCATLSAQVSVQLGELEYEETLEIPLSAELVSDAMA